MNAEQETLETAIGYSFKDEGLLRRALTHKSYAHEKSSAGPPACIDNEQLEFLGDAILGFVVSDLLVAQYPALAEGRLSELKAQLVSADHLHQVAECLPLGRHLLLGRGEEMSGGRGKRALLADALEALIAAIYLDSGLEGVRAFVLRHVVGEIEAYQPLAYYKSALRTIALRRGLPPPQYVVVMEQGPDHAKTFRVEVRVGEQWTAQAEALSKRTAERKAAQVLLQKLAVEGS